MDIPVKMAFEFLNRDPMKNISIINFLETHPEARCEKLGDSLLIRENGVVYISANSPGDLDIIMDNLNPEDKFFASLEGWVGKIIKGDKETKWYLNIPRYALPLDTTIPEPEHPTQPLSSEHAQVVTDSWIYGEADEGTKSYVLACLERGPTSAVYVDGEPVAWAGVHEDGALGFLYTQEEHRGKGYAEAVTLDLLRQQREQGKVSFVNIEEGKNSLGLAMKLGFVHVGDSCWVEFE